MTDVSLVALCCRTSDRTPGGVRGAQTLAPLIGKRLGIEPRTIGTRGRAARDHASTRTCATRAAACSRRAARSTTRSPPGACR